MARARNIKPGFFKNEDLAECSFPARLCFAGLWTLADREGRLEDRPKRIKAELFPFDTVDVEPLLQELARFKFILRYETDGMKAIQVLEFGKHQSPHYSENQSVIKAPELPESKPDDDNKTPENSRSRRVIKRGSQPPDSLNPDSLNPEEDSEPIGSAAAAAPTPEPQPEPMTDKDRLWALGVAILGEKGRSFLGKAVATWGEATVLACLVACNAEKPGEPKSWLTQAFEARGKALKSPARTNGNHAATTEDLLSRDPHPQWALEAGFSDLWQAESAGCGPGNAAQFRNGRRVTQ